jgi:hypothetical protein
MAFGALSQWYRLAGGTYVIFRTQPRARRS